MGMSVSTGSGVKAEPNVVPMIDVMLVLLIIFMVVTPALTSGFQAQPPEGINLKEHPEDEENDVVLGIDKFGKYYLQKMPISDKALPESLRAIYSRRPDDKVLYLKADRGLRYADIMKAYDIAAHNGVTVVGDITDQRLGTKSGVPGDILSDKKKR